MRFLMMLCGAGLLAASVAMAAPGLAESLPEKPCGIGRPASDRAWWGAWAKTPESSTALKRAEACLNSPMPAFDAERYLDYTTNGDRTRYQAQHSRRWDRLTRLVLGECIEDKGRFLKAIDETVAGLCADPSWLLPAHDRNAQVFKGGRPYVDLAVAMNGYEMALAAWLLDGRLPAPTVTLMRENVARRLTGPVMLSIDGTAPAELVAGHWWARSNMNWNAVCTAGAVGAILACEPSRDVRAKAVEWAVKNMDVYLSGFAADGYCSEGVGYWNYGFGHFVVLGAVLREQSGGRVDLFKAPTLRRIAEAPAQLEIASGIYPAFADCALTARPDPRLLEEIRWCLDKQSFSGSASAALAESASLYQTLLDLSLRCEAKAGGTAGGAPLPLRSWFPQSGVCVVRPARAGGMAAAWKGGHNGEHHNHNDVGTTVVVWQGKAVIADPGAMVYRAETFSKDRYRLPVLGSFGHSVPVVAGTLQAEGAKCRGQVLDTKFTEARDSVLIDMSSAYLGTGLRMLERKWIYQREGRGALVIEDRFGFDKPAAFADACVGFGDWYLVKGGDRSARFLIDGGQGAVLEVDVEFSAPGKWDVRRLDNPDRPAANRLGLTLSEPAADGFVRMTIRPAAGGQAHEGVPGTKLEVGTVPAKLADPLRAP